MLWRMFSQGKFYVSLTMAMVGLSAASAMIVSQEPKAREVRPQTAEPVGADNVGVTATIPSAVNMRLEDLRTLESDLRALQRQLGEQHPKVRELKVRVDEEKARRDAAIFEARQQIWPKGKTTVLTEDIRPGGTSIVSQTTIPARAPASFYPVAPTATPALTKAIERMRSSKSNDSEKADARKQVVDILGKQFDDDMQQRSRKIEELEKQLATLKEQMDKRKAAKDRLIDLRIELLQNEEEGLGFPNVWNRSPTSSFPYATVPYAVPIGTTEGTIDAYSLPAGFAAPSVPQPPAAPAPPAP